MLRFLVKYLLLAIILAAITILTARWKLEKDLDNFAHKISPFAEFDYESAKIGLTGEVKISSIRVRILALNSTLEVGEIKFSAGNLIEMAFFESNLNKNKLPENAHLEFTDVLLPFDTKLINKMSSNVHKPTTSDFITSAYCGNNDVIGLKQMSEMGYNYLSFSGKAFYLLDKYSGSIVVNGNIDFEEISDIDYQFNIGSVMAWVDSIKEREVGQYQPPLVTPQLSLLEVRVKDKGYNKNKALYCALKQNVPVKEYYQQHIIEIENLLARSNIQLKDDLKQAYTQSIMPNSQTTFFIKPSINIDWDAIKYYNLDELLDLTGLRLTVNGQQVIDYFDGWNTEAFYGVGEAIVKKREEVIKPNELYRTVTIKKKYVKYDPIKADSYQSQQIRVVRDDGKTYEGVLSRSNRKSLWIFKRLPTGDIEIPIARNRIIKFEVYQ